MGLMAFVKEVGVTNWIVRTTQRQFFKRVLKRQHSMRLPTGEWFHLPLSSRFASEAYITNGDVDWGSERLLFEMLVPNSCLLDVGANIGYYSLYMAPKCQYIFAFEPDPRMHSLLLKCVAHQPAIEVVQKAIGRSIGRARFVLEPDGEVSHLAPAEFDADSTIEVDIVTIDEFVAERALGLVSAIKIDIEGYDIDAVIGARETMKSLRPVVLTEARPEVELFSALQGLEYSVFAYVRSPESRLIRFEAIPPGGSPHCETKMLFLVPDERSGELSGKAKALLA